jgi:flagellar hook protein FlgE
MASTNAMYTGLSGMNANARRLDVIGNNIANANTTAFKSSSMYFETQFSRTLSNGTQPSTNDGGTNPYQIGLGVKIAGTTRDFNPGSISATGNGRDMAIDGKGFFIINRGSQQLFHPRGLLCAGCPEQPRHAQRGPRPGLRR